jgi:hypothetical protein
MGFSPATATGLDLAVEGTSPVVGFSDGSAGGKVTVMTYDGGAWRRVGKAGFSTHAVDTVSIAVSAEGRLYAAYRDAGADGKATVMRYEAEGGWSAVGEAGISAGKVSYVHLALDAAGTPYLAFRDGAQDNRVTVMKYQE